MTGRLRAGIWLASGRRTHPISENWGRERGTPVDRWFIERFLAGSSADIHGRVLEVLDDGYTKRFGRNVTAAEILDVDASNARATLVADLETPDSFPHEAFDCIVLTQTLQYVYDLPNAIESVHRALRPGGVCLATVPVLSRLDRAGIPRGEFWRVTATGCERLFGERFGTEQVEVAAHGNALTCVAFLLGLAAEDLSETARLEVHPFFPLLVSVRAVKKAAAR